MRRRRRWSSDDRTEREPGERASFLEEDIDRLERALQPYSIYLDELARERILLFSRELISWNDRLNLLSRSDAPNVIRKHVAASVGVFLAVPPSPTDRWVDVGTGAGFPGLVLKIFQPDIDITLLDSARKRCLFLENAIRAMELGRVPVLPLRVETLIARGQRLESFTVMTCRAVSSLPDTLRDFGPLVAPGGRIVTFKGPQWVEEVEATQAAGVFETTRFSLETTTRIPWTAGHLLTLRKA